MLKVARLDVISSGARQAVGHWMRSNGSWRRVTRRARGRCRRQHGGMDCLRASYLRGAGLPGMVALRKGGQRRTTFAPVLVGDDSSRCSLPLPPEQLDPLSLSPKAHPSARVSGRIEIVLMRGHRVIVDSGVDAAVLARVPGGIWSGWHDSGAGAQCSGMAGDLGTRT